MNPERLLQHFERISEAPDAIPRLRRFILDLAVRGKLVEQDPSDEPAVELLKRIQAEKARLRREGLIANEKSSLTVLSTELPFAIPSGWQCARFIDYAIDISTGPFGSILHQSDYVEGGVPLVNPSHMVNGRIVPAQNVAVSCETGRRLSAYKLRAGDIVMARRGEVGRAAVVYGREDGWLCGTGSFFLRFTEEVCREYLMVLLRCEFIRNYLAGEAVGITMVNLNHGILKRMPLPIPPLAEQHRIVAKVDELMALCDQLEAAKTEREQSRDRLVAASLHRLHSSDDTAETDAPDLPARQADAFRGHARFVFHHLPRLTTRLEHIKQLRQTILNLAVRGKLVPQKSNDEPADELFIRLAQSKQQKGMQGRKGAKLQQLNDENSETPFQIPSNWLWLRIGTLFEVAGGIQKTPLRAPKSNAFPYLGVGNVYRGRIDLTTVKEFELQDGELERWRLEVGDLLIIEGNGSLSEIGRCAVWNGEIESCVHQNHVIRCRPLDLQISPFVLQFLNSPAGTAIMQRLAITSSGLYSLSVGKIRQIEVPLPPLAEQHRIVARVDELMALCDQLEAQLTTTEADSRRLLEAVLYEALNPLAEVTEQGGRLQAGSMPRKIDLLHAERVQ